MLTILVGKKAKGGEELPFERYSKDELRALSSTAGLFGEVHTFVLEGALYGARGADVLDLAGAFAQSPHTFLLEEEKLLKAESEALSKAGARIEKQEAPQKKEWAFDRFGAAAALGARDRKRLWLALMQAFAAGEKPEALAGLLAWKARQMQDSGLSRRITCMYHDAHRGAGDLALLLERFALTL